MGDFLRLYLIVGQTGADVGQLQLDPLPVPTLLIGPLAADEHTLGDDLHPLGQGFGDIRDDGQVYHPPHCRWYEARGLWSTVR